MKLSADNIFSKIEASLHLKNPFVWYKKPHQNILKGYVQHDYQISEPSKTCENCFIFSPFDPTKEAYYLSFDQAIMHESTLDLKELKVYHTADLNVEQKDKAFHINLVQKTIDYILKESVEKIVISRKQSITFDFTKTIDLFQNLLYLYPEAMVYMWFHPKTGLWIGATPEKLVSTEQHLFHTMSLAGTQLYQENITWQEKEKKEQQLVTDYMINKLQPIVLDLSLSYTFTKKAGNLAHLCTLISGNLKPEISLMEFIHHLHPTPAVCGTPPNLAQKFIMENEGYNRTFYTGFLGEINRNNASDLYVNLRCMQLEGNTANLYVGGGITAKSIPEHEWQETVYKSEILGKILPKYV